MNYSFKGKLLPIVVFSDDTLTVGKKEYQYKDITNVVITYKPTMATNGAASIVVNGKTIAISFTKKDSELFYQAIDELKEIINENEAQSDVCLNTASDIATYCLAHSLGQGMTRKWTEKHFQLIVDNLLEQEEIYLPFVGLYNFKSATKHEGNYAIALTNKRIILAQQKLVGEDVKTISLERINDITHNKGKLFSTITIDTAKEMFNVAVSRDSGQMIFEGLHKALDEIKNPQEPIVVRQEKSPIDQVKELKELLDMGILSEEEFDKKKRELLNL